MNSRFGYALSGHKAYDLNPTARGTRVSTIGAIHTQGLVTSMSFQGTLNGERFAEFIKEFLAPHLSPNHVVVLDNASPHKNKKAIELIKNTGAEVVYLPPYSPEMNPIEYCWAKAKQLFRKIKPRTVEQLYDTWEKALEQIDQTLTSSCFKHCGLL